MLPGRLRRGSRLDESFRQKQGWRFTAGFEYQNSTSAGQKGRLHADTLDHENVVFDDHCFVKVLGNYNNCCGEGIEVYRNGIEVWKWLWNCRVLSIPDFCKSWKIMRFFVKISQGLLPFELPSGNKVDGLLLVAIRLQGPASWRSKKCWTICNFECFFVQGSEFVLHGFSHPYFSDEVQWTSKPGSNSAIQMLE